MAHAGATPAAVAPPAGASAASGAQAPKGSTAEKTEPRPHLAFHPNGATHQLDQPLRDGKPEAGAAVQAGNLVVLLLERVEYALHVLRMDAAARVLHGKAEPLRLPARRAG